MNVYGMVGLDLGLATNRAFANVFFIFVASENGGNGNLMTTGTRREDASDESVSVYHTIHILSI